MRERAGVSPAIATILLILIAISVGVTMYAYTQGYLGIAPSGKGVGQIAIQAAYLADGETDEDSITLYVKNVGGTDLEISDLYIELMGGGSLVYLDTMDIECEPDDCIVSPGETIKIMDDDVGTVKGAIVGGRYSSVRVVCADGTADSRSLRVRLKHSSGSIIVSATVDVKPETLNRNSGGNYVTAYIELPSDFDVGDIDVETVLLNDTVPAELDSSEVGDYDDDDVLDLKVKFNREEVIAILPIEDGVVSITISGNIGDLQFRGSDDITIIS